MNMPAPSAPLLMPAGSAAAPPGAPPAPDEAADDPVDRTARLGRRLLTLGLFAALAWLALAPLDEGVPAGGTVVVDTQRKPVQHLSGGIVRRVHVREGQAVQAGELLLQLDPVAAAANREAVLQRYLGLCAAESRLRAERDGLAAITWHADLRKTGRSEPARAHMAAQQDLFIARRRTLAADLAGLDESLQAQRGMRETAERMRESRQQQLALVRDELAHTRSLVQDGYAPRNRQLELERQESETMTLVTDLQGQAERAQRSIAELQQRAEQRRGEFRRETSQQLAEVLRDLQAESERLASVEADLQRTELRAPVAGQVVGLTVQTPGTVVEPARVLMNIVPGDEGLVIEVQLPPSVIDRVRPGLEVDARFRAFAHTPQLVVPARVMSVSADRLVDPATQAAYYLARVTVTPEGQRVLGPRRMQPGMPAEVVIRTGERSLLTYWLDPLTKRIARAMKEE